MLPTITVIVLIIVVGVSVLAFRNRAAKGIESGITSFRRELRALAPENDQLPRARRPPEDPPRTSGVGVLRPDRSPDSSPGSVPVDDGHAGAGDDDTDDTDDTGDDTGEER